MSTVTILYGTESGNAELIADDIAETLEGGGVDSSIEAMDEFDVGTFSEGGTFVVITSTYGEGELPETTAPFFEALHTKKPDLGAVRFAAFGLGDSTYETYNNGIEILREQLSALGGSQVGETGRHDAASGESFTSAASSWAAKLLTDL